MDTNNAWQAFVETGNILSYLDYRQQATDVAVPAVHEDRYYGSNYNIGAGASGSKI